MPGHRSDAAPESQEFDGDLTAFAEEAAGGLTRYEASDRCRQDVDGTPDARLSLQERCILD